MGKMNLQKIELESNVSNLTNRYNYSMAIQDLQHSGYISLDNIQKLSCSDLYSLCEEIKFWCLYGNQDLGRLKSLPKADVISTLY